MKHLINPYLVGNFAPVRDEISAENLTVIGELPRDLNGIFIRNGPNQRFEPQNNYHWFDGDGMLHRILLQDGRASYRNRYVRTRSFEHESKANRALWGSILDKRSLRHTFFPPHGIFLKNVANVSLVWHSGRLMALWEMGYPHEITVPDLNTVHAYNYDGYLAHTFTAHPKIDAITEEMMFFGYTFGRRKRLKYSIVSPEGKIVHTEPIHLPKMVMLHDFAITKTYTIFMDLPMEMSIFRQIRGKNMFQFNNQRPSRFGIMPRYGNNDDIHWFEAPPCYIYHTVNAWEEGDKIVLVGCRIQEVAISVPRGHHAGGPPSTNRMKLGGGNPEQIANLYRWTFDLKSGQMYEEQLDDRIIEFPRHHEGLTGRRNRYAYTALGTMPGSDKAQLFYGLVKYDLLECTGREHHFGRNCYGGEAVFVARSNQSAEDDGWLLTIVFDATINRSELIVIDAQHIEQPPIARVLLPQRVPFGFHSIWLTENQMTSQF